MFSWFSSTPEETWDRNVSQWLASGCVRGGMGGMRRPGVVFRRGGAARRGIGCGMVVGAICKDTFNTFGSTNQNLPGRSPSVVGYQITVQNREAHHRDASADARQRGRESSSPLNPLSNNPSGDQR